MADDKASLSVEDALKMYERYKSFWNENYTESNIDLKMAAGDPATHWGAAYAERVSAKQLTMVINELPQFIHQVTNDIRQNTPSAETIPENDGDIETAQIFSDLIRDIEYKSSADEAYDTAAEYAVKCAIGFIRVDHDYCNDDSDEQELQIKKVHDPLSVWIDPASIECDGRDANGGIALEPINREDFERLYPGKGFISFTEPKNIDHKNDSIVLAEIFKREFTGKHGKTPIIRRYKFSGADMLAETTFPGDYIPIVPVIGEDVWIDGKRILASLIRQARDPQLRLNHWACKEQQILNMAPIAPVMAEEGTLVNDRGQWQRPGSEMVLEYKRNGMDGNPANVPTRLAPPPIPTGILNAMEGAKQNIKESLGMYNASIGEKSNETSGIAIQRRQHEGDVATFHFPDNVRRSVTQVTRILASAIPIVYDTQRVIQTMNGENEPKLVSINGAPLQEGQKQPFDLTKGKYRVRVTTGASYTTKRQEAAAFLSDLFKQAPELLNVGGDILFKNMDLPGAQAMAERMKKIIGMQNPALIEDENNPQQVDPQVAQMQQVIQQGQQAMQQLAAENEQLKAEQQNKQADTQIKGGELQLKQQELQLKAKELELKEQESQAKYQLEHKKIDADLTQARITAKSTAHPDVAMTDPEMNEGVSPLAEILAILTQSVQNQTQTEAMLAQGLQQLASAQQESTQAATATSAALINAINQPKSVIFGDNGIPLGIQ